MFSWTVFDSANSSLKAYAELLSKIECQDNIGIKIDGFEKSLKLVHVQTSANKKLIFLGNGGSAAIASHAATDFFKNGGVRTTTFNDASLLTCLSNDYKYEEAFERGVERMADKGDIVFAISSSGKSPNILKAAQVGTKMGAQVITLSGFGADNPLRKLGDINFYIPSNSYAHVENLHLLICHMVLDSLMVLREKK
jgi:D-sedoheptulose 7-phosphate isomerase